MRTIGIYKITSPSGRIYIGQSVCIENRFRSYNGLYKVSEQRKLYNSFIKYGVKSHIFEILEICNKEELNIKEYNYIKQYDCIKKGLNIREGGNVTPHSEETKKILSKRHKERWINLSDELKEKYLTRLKNESPKGSEKAKENGRKASISRKGYKISEETKKLLSLNSTKAYKIQIFKDGLYTIYPSIRTMCKDLNLDRNIFKNKLKTLEFIYENIVFKRINESSMGSKKKQEELNKLNK